jgi:F-type H+-transporting ATPase subunit c
MGQTGRVIAGGIAATSISGSGVGIGLVFSALIIGTAINPRSAPVLFSYAVLGFALSEAIALFGLMITFLLLYS